MIFLITIFISANFRHILSAPPPFPGYNPYFPQMPYFPPHMPMPYPPYYPQYHIPSMVPGMVPPSLLSSGLVNSVPGAASIAAALNIPSSQAGMADENIAGQLGNSIQLPTIPKETNIPLNLLSAKVAQPKSPQVGASTISPPIPDEPVKTAPLPVLY